MSLNKIDTPLKELTLVFFFVIIGVVMHLGVGAADNATVTATVTAQQIAVSVSDASIAYQTLQVGTSATTAESDGDAINDTQFVSNDGNVNEDFDLQGQNSTSWTLADAPGSETYVHEFCDTDCDGTPTWHALSTSLSAVELNVGSGVTWPVDFRLQMPSSTTEDGQQNVDVTVQCSAS